MSEQELFWDLCFIWHPREFQL